MSEPGPMPMGSIPTTVAAIWEGMDGETIEGLTLAALDLDRCRPGVLDLAARARAASTGSCRGS